MRIAQILLPDASQFDRKCQRADFAVLSEKHDVTLTGDARDLHADVAHVYGAPQSSAAMFVGFPIPYVASSTVARARWSFRNPVAPARVLSPLEVTEPVEPHYFEIAANAPQRQKKIVASVRRPRLDDFIHRTLARIERFRDDVEWHLVDAPPSPETLAGVDLWVDPALSDDDLDGFVAEALVVGTPVVASRTSMNRVRLEEGRTGFFVPLNDPNEMTHAILTALFKPEVADSRRSAAKQTAGKFRPRQRYRALLPLYERLIS